MQPTRATTLAAAAAALTLASHAARATPVVQYSGATVTGVSNLDVNGNLYDVAFINGTCASVFGTCNTASFAFTTIDSALAAGTALVDSLTGVNPTTIEGCNAATQGCYMLVPFAVDTNPAYVDVASSELLVGGGSNVVATAYAMTFNTSGDATRVYADFTAVPEPGSAVLLGAGLAGLAGIGLRRRRTQV